MTRRLPARPDRDEIDPLDLADYDEVVARQAKLWEGAPSDSNAYFGALLNAPPVAAGIAVMGRLMRSGQARGTYSDADREFVDMVMSVDFDYRAIMALHIPDAIAVGVRLEAIEALWDGREDDLTPREQLLAAHVRAVVAGRVDDERFERLVAELGQRTAIEYTAFITFLLMTMRLWQALGVPDPPRAEIDELLASYRAGTGPVLDPGARIG
jgi:hypothetical protein